MRSLSLQGRKDLNRLVRDFQTGDSLRCLTEAVEGCPKGAAGAAGRTRSRMLLE